METNKSALSLILYPFQFNSGIDEKWSEAELSRLARNFSLEKLLLIDKHIENYFRKKDVNLAEALPSMDETIAEKEQLLLHISKGIELLVEKKAS